jgi:hypothetical protein
MSAPDIAQIARGLTKAQRRLILASERGGWGRDDTATGVPLKGPQFQTARSLERLRLGDYSYGSCFEDLYFNNQTGLAVRDYLKENPQ